MQRTYATQNRLELREKPSLWRLTGEFFKEVLPRTVAASVIPLTFVLLTSGSRHYNSCSQNCRWAGTQPIFSENKLQPAHTDCRLASGYRWCCHTAIRSTFNNRRAAGLGCIPQLQNTIAGHKSHRTQAGKGTGSASCHSRRQTEAAGEPEASGLVFYTV